MGTNTNYWADVMAKPWGIALKKNVVRDERDGWRHVTKAYVAFRKFKTREEAREFKREHVSPTLIINRASGCVVR